MYYSVEVNQECIRYDSLKTTDMALCMMSFRLSRTVLIGGALVKIPKTKFPPILSKLEDLVGISFIKLYLNYNVKILITALLFLT
jgi:hypothetical protein